MNKIDIAGRKIGKNHPPFIIAEMSGNHNSSLASIKAFQKAGYKESHIVEYCDTLHTERGEKQGIQSKPKGGI